MPNTIPIQQPYAEDGTEISLITRTNSIYKSDGTPLGDSLDAYMDKVDELSQNLAEKFATITGTFPSTSGFANMNYPTGYTVNNCVLVSAEVYYSSTWRSLVGITAENVPTRFFTQLGAQVSLYNNSPSLYGATVRVTLMRTDI